MAMVASAALAQTSVPGAAPAIPAVASYSDGQLAQSAWFKAGPDNSALSRLVAILQRAPFDGFAAGPQLAAQVQTVIAQAHSGNPADSAAAERTLSAAWVEYVQAIKKPTAGMIYAYPVLQP